MPIEQERFLSLLSAAEDFEQALQTGYKVLQREASLVFDSGLEPKAAFENLLAMANPELLLREPVESTVRLRTERARFDPARIKRNERNRRRQRRRRDAADAKLDEL